MRPSSVNVATPAYLKTYEQTVLLAKAAAGDPVPDEIPEPLVKVL